MKPNYDDIQAVMSVFEQADEPTVPVRELLQMAELGMGEKRLAFALAIMDDLGLVEGFEGVFTRTRTSRLWIAGAELRMTARGHDFASALRQPPVQKAMASVAEHAPAAVVKFAIDLASGITKLAFLG